MDDFQPHGLLKSHKPDVGNSFTVWCIDLIRTILMKFVSMTIPSQKWRKYQQVGKSTGQECRLCKGVD